VKYGITTTNKFDNVMSLFLQYNKRDPAMLLNHRMLQVAVGSGDGAKFPGLVHTTQKATVARIRADMAEEINGMPRVTWLAMGWLKKRGVKFEFGDATVSATEELIIKARIRSRAFIAASWLFSARELAKYVPGAKFDRMHKAPDDMELSERGHVARTARAVPARPGSNKFFCALYNTAPSHPHNVQRGTSDGAARVAKAGKARALNAQIRDMRDYIRRKMKEELNAIKQAARTERSNRAMMFKR
jgi:hypothetical protein